MRKKVMLAVIIAFCFFMVTTTSVNARDDNRTFNDSTGDVIDSNNTEVPEIENIDIKTITYTQDDEEVTIELEFVGIIEESEELIISVSLLTDEDSYELLYFGTELIGQSTEVPEFTPGLSGFGTTKIEFSFNLNDDDEKYESIIIFTSFGDIYYGDGYTDTFPNFDDFPDVYIEGPTEGKVGENLKFYSYASGGVPPYTYEWSVSDEDELDETVVSTKQNPSIMFKTPGEKFVTVQILDSVGTPYLNTSFITITGSSLDVDSSDDNSGLITFAALIIVIVIAGVAAVIFVIRR